MGFNFKKSTTFRLAQAAKAQRARSGAHLSRIGLHPGQEAVLKVLSEADGRTMSQLALALGVQPPTVTKMVTRLTAQGLVERQLSDTDGRLARVYLTQEGQDRIQQVDRAWKRLEREALAGLDDKDRKKLRKLLRVVEKNLSNKQLDDDDDEDDDADDAKVASDKVVDALPVETQV
ncbi:MarR family transcriptional regulator [Pseudovibrio sp. SPO723]|uniref:MarR family winged helix-turn-helix transcriptional regulator n=1 Tax=Nesiotobacter zosterae TaxID=392721 RepID=UPI0029C50DF6|nr:MarR family transcriptional regulator [Pseudovibrio sp. SPO723]MDX5594751.1 MarR family transcriptional regulator [Pseudovibrio sp. SPO723]